MMEAALLTVENKATFDGKGGNRTLLVSMTVFAMLLAACGPSEDEKRQKMRGELNPPDSSYAPPSAGSVKQEKPLSPLFVAAQKCLATCSGKPKNRHYPDTAIVLPEKFQDFIDKVGFGRDGFLALLSELPSNYLPIAIRGEAERDSLTMDGYITYVMQVDGDPIHLYFNAGYPEKEWANHKEYRRPAGMLDVAVNPQKKTMAAIFKGGHDLSSYRFIGDKTLLEALIAHTAADEAEAEAAHLVSATQEADHVMFPIPEQKLARVMARLKYLNELYDGNQITGARSAYDAGNNARKTPPEKQWWTAGSSFTECHETGGPAAKLDEFVGFTDKPEVKDFRDSSGKLYKVEVTLWDRGNGRVWTYYKEQSRCEAEQVNATKSLADKYR
jgi:hypothetical protein